MLYWCVSVVLLCCVLVLSMCYDVGVLYVVSVLYFVEFMLHCAFGAVALGCVSVFYCNVEFLYLLVEF